MHMREREEKREARTRERERESQKAEEHKGHSPLDPPPLTLSPSPNPLLLLRPDRLLILILSPCFLGLIFRMHSLFLPVYAHALLSFSFLLILNSCPEVRHRCFHSKISLRMHRRARYCRSRRLKTRRSDLSISFQDKAFIKGICTARLFVRKILMWAQKNHVQFTYLVDALLLHLILAKYYLSNSILIYFK